MWWSGSVYVTDNHKEYETDNVMPIGSRFFQSWFAYFWYILECSVLWRRLVFLITEKKQMSFLLFFAMHIQRLLRVSFHSMTCSQVWKFRPPRSSHLFHLWLTRTKTYSWKNAIVSTVRWDLYYFVVYCVLLSSRCGFCCSATCEERRKWVLHWIRLFIVLEIVWRSVVCGMLSF